MTNKEFEIWEFAVKKLERREALILLAVAESSGSSPGRRGFKMIVSADEMSGSIGGGVMEVQLVELARDKLRVGKDKSKIQNLKSKIEMVHRKDSPDSSGMICSGKQTVIFLELKPADLKTVRRVISALENDQPKVIQISNFKFQISEAGSQRFDFRFEQTGEDGFFYQERLGYKNKLFIVGGGHCALALSELAAKMDFFITLLDDRSELNTLAKNEFVQKKIIIDSYENIGEFIDSGENHFVVVMTLGYKFDEIVIRRLFEKDFRYFGVLGSRAKMATLLKDLRKDGFDDERLKSIRTPIGLPINSQTPEEIAVSIMAEIIAVKNK